MKEGGDEELVVDPTDDLIKQNASYLAVIQNLGIAQNNTEEIT